MSIEKQGEYEIVCNGEMVSIKGPKGEGGCFQRHVYQFNAAAPEGGMNGYVFGPKSGGAVMTQEDWDYFVDVMSKVDNVLLTDKHMPMWLRVAA